jgi:drug/metabolite transporter (DMT)-like permease
MGNVILLILANVIWAGSYSVMKWGVVDIHPLSLVFYRMTLATLVLWPIVFFVTRDQLRKINWSFCFRIFLVAAFDLIHQAGLCVGVKYSYATDAALIISMEPVFLFFLATLILHEHLTVRHIISLILALVGFVVLSDFAGMNGALARGAVLLGNVIILVAVISETGFTVFFKPLAKSFSPILLMAAVTLIQSIILAPITYIIDPNWLNTEITLKSITVIGYLALGCTVFGYVIWLLIMKKVPVNVMAVSLFLQPVFGPVIAAATLGEVLGPRVIVGGVIVIFSLYVISSKKIRVDELAPTN